MKKRMIFILWISGLLCVLSGCVPRPEAAGTIKTGNYDIVPEIYTRGENISIAYPSLQKKKEDFSAVNSLILETVLEYALGGYEDDFAGLSLELQFRAPLAGSEILSLIFEGYRYLENTAHPTDVFFTVNIELRRAILLQLPDMVNVAKSSKKEGEDKHAPAKAYLLYFEGRGAEATGILPEKNSAEALTALFQEADLPGAEVWSYWTEDVLGISISAPHVTGGHIETEIPRYEILDSVLISIR